MLTIPHGVHILTTKREYTDKSGTRKTYQAHLLRRTYREGGKVKAEVLSNLTGLGDPLVALLKRALRGEQIDVLGTQFEIEKSWHHGHVRTVLLAMERLGMAKLLAARPCAERTLCLAMIAARVLAPASKLATSNWFSDTTLAMELGLDAVNENDLYAAMDWLLEQQPGVEKRLAKRHLHGGCLVLFDLSSTWVEGEACPLAAFGYNRDRKRGKQQINFGLVTDGDGRPVAVEVFRGNVGDPNTLMPQVERVTKQFGIKDFVMVGDRGMLSQKHIDTLRAEYATVQWLTALRTEAIAKLVGDKSIRQELFDEKNFFEIKHELFPGERLVACRNPALAKSRAHKREELLAATEADLLKISARIESGRLKDAGKIGVAAGRVVNKHKMAKHFVLEIGAQSLKFSRDEAAIATESELDGLYVIRTSVPAEKRTAAETVHDYKRLTQVEHAFRSIKTVDLHVRPIWHYDEKRVKAHIFLCMLGYYVQWHLEKALAPLTFADDAPAPREARDPVAPAQPSERTRAKQLTKRNKHGEPVARLSRVLANMATIVRNRCSWPGQTATFDVDTQPNEMQRRVLELVGAMVA